MKSKSLTYWRNIFPQSLVWESESSRESAEAVSMLSEMYVESPSLKELWRSQWENDHCLKVNWAKEMVP
jgi:hypothetical protein